MFLKLYKIALGPPVNTYLLLKTFVRICQVISEHCWAKNTDLIEKIFLYPTLNKIFVK